MYILYCDDSGTHAQSDIAVAACYVGTAEQWSHFNRNWQEANDTEGFGVFHMADFVAHQGRFAMPEWQEDAKRERTLRRLIGITNTRARLGFFAAVEKSAYDEEVPPELKEKLTLGRNHYTFAVRMCMAKVLKWRLQYRRMEPIQFVFDRMSKGRGEIDAIFKEALKEGDEAALLHGISRHSGWSFQSREEHWPLQSADILAWETLHFFRYSYLPEKKEFPRASYLQLLKVARKHAYHDRESLRAWVLRVRNRTKGNANS